jgi:hypothetical protein
MQPCNEEFAMKSILTVPLVVIALGGIPVAQADAYYAAAAFSQSTGTAGYSYNCRSKAQAKRMALKNCDADDAEIVGWVKNGYCALAVGKDPGSYGWAGASAEEDAKAQALEKCGEYTTGCYILFTVYSGAKNSPGFTHGRE